MKKLIAGSFSELFGVLFDPRVPLSFLFGTLALAVAGNAAYALVLRLASADEGLGAENPISLWKLIVILTVAILVMFLAVFVFMIVLRTKWQTSLVDGSEAFKIPRKAIVFSVGKQKGSILLALEKQRPPYVGFIVTKESGAVLEEIRSELPNKLIERSVDPWDVKIIHRATVEIITSLQRDHGLQASEIVIDITGGLTTLSVAMFRAAEDQGIDTQYIRSQYDKNNRPIPGTQQAILLTKHQQDGSEE